MRAATNGSDMDLVDAIIKPDDLILVTGASGFIGPRVVESLLGRGFRNLRCFARPSSNLVKLESLVGRYGSGVRIELIKGNLLSSDDCTLATKDVAVIYNLAAGRGEKAFPDAFMNSVVTTRNLLEASRRHGCLRRFVNVSSLSVYSNRNKSQRRLLDESCPVEDHPELRGDAYTFAKAKQDEMVIEYGRKFNLPYVIVRPGVVYGPGNEAVTGRVGIGTFGLFLHLGGANTIPFTYVDNCAEAIVLAGLKAGVDGEIFNVVDDHLPSSRRFLRSYKKNVRPFPSLYLPHGFSYLLCCAWEKYSEWSEGQLPPIYNRRVWHAYWKRTRYSNNKLKTRLGWSPKVGPADAFGRYFESCNAKERVA
jgi:nucleoside-diphosphate-sugar epimerase